MDVEAFSRSSKEAFRTKLLSSFCFHTNFLYQGHFLLFFPLLSYIEMWKYLNIPSVFAVIREFGKTSRMFVPRALFFPSPKGLCRKSSSSRHLTHRTSETVKQLLNDNLAVVRWLSPWRSQKV